MGPKLPTRLLSHLQRHQFTPIPSRHHYTTALLIPKPHSTTQPLFNSHRHPTIFDHPQHPILRFLSTRPVRPTRPRKPDIGARARQLQSRRLWTYALTFSCIAGFVTIVLNQFQDQLSLLRHPHGSPRKVQLRSDKSQVPPRRPRARENSVAQIPSSPEIQFVITDLIIDILVKYEGSLPDLFREGHSAVVEGFIKPLDEETKKKEKIALKNSSKLGVSEKARTLECYFRGDGGLGKARREVHAG